MKVLFVGDVCGDEGVNYLFSNLEKIKKDNGINLVIVNGENASLGKGISIKIYKEMMRHGISAVTMGNHTFGNKEIYDLIDDNAKIVIPANLPDSPKNGFITIKYNDKTITIINLLGRVYMNNLALDCPFKKAKEIIDSVKSDYYLIDFHAEATSEKKALGYYLDGINGALVGTHTHVPTCDEETLDGGLMYITDVGMTGVKDGVIGADKDNVIKKFLDARPSKYLGATGRCQFNAVILDYENKKITRINIKEK